MITILTGINNVEKVTSIIKKVDRLDELVTVSKYSEGEHPAHQIEVKENKIHDTIDWLDVAPPYLFPEMNLSETHLLALIFYKLGNHEKAIACSDNASDLHFHLMIASSLQKGFQLQENLILSFLSRHNECVVKHYGILDRETSIDELKELYLNAIINSSSSEERAFTVKHYCNLLIDDGNFEEAEKLLKTNLYENHLPSKATIALKSLLSTSMMNQLSFPFNKKKLAEIQDIQENCIAYYESIDQLTNAGLLYIDASEIANYQEDYIASKDLINKAILIFKQENITEFLGEASLRKATLLYTWSKNGSPHYYKSAINAFQDTLKVFKKENYPEQYANIHHNLALIYSEIPVSPEEKPIWTAFCASSFKEVLSIYNKENYPYEFAMVCHNYATALIHFPKAKLHSNIDKANSLFEDALLIRTSEQYPFERALTLTNQIELLWLVHNETDKDELENYQLMHKKANEIKTLVNDPKLIENAEEQLKALEKLKTVLN